MTTRRAVEHAQEEMAARVSIASATTWQVRPASRCATRLPLFRLLCLSMLLSARISNELAVRAHAP